MMPVLFSPNLIELPEESSDTPFGNLSIRPWVQNLLTDEAGIISLTEAQRSMVKRVLGMALVWYMPATGLQETLEVLTQTLDFYANESPRLITAPEELFTATFLPETETPGIFLAES